MSAPVPSYRNTTTDLTPQPTQVEPPEHAELRNVATDGRRQFVMGKCDTIKSLFYRVYPEALTPGGRGYLGGESHLRAYLENRPGGFPKPGDVVNLPPFDNYIGKAKAEQLNGIVDRMEKEQPRCREDRAKVEQGSRQSDGATRMAGAIFPPSIAQPSALKPSWQNRTAGLVVGRIRQDIPAPVRSRY